jgi:hypothetical protein
MNSRELPSELKLVPPEEPIKVQVVPDPPKPPRPTPKWATWIVGILILLIITALVLRVTFAMPYTVAPIGTGSSEFPLQIETHTRQVIPLQDVWEITLTVTNTGAQPLNATLTLLPQPTNGVRLAKDGAASFEMKNLAPGGAQTHTFAYIATATPPENRVTFSMRLTNANGNTTRLTNPQWALTMLPIPYLRQTSEWILTGGALGFFISLFWDRLKKALFG